MPTHPTGEGLPQVKIYTDGGCNPNPGPGGWAAILLFPGQKPRELVGSEPATTNNRMELRAALEALRALPGPHQVELYTDSNYLRQGIIDWLPRWIERGWRTAGRSEVKNQDLWQALAGQMARHRLAWHWVKGHAGNRWNERADDLARSAVPGAAPPPPDEVGSGAIHLFTAASYLGNERRGGWGVLLRYGDQVETLSGGARDTSSNRLQLTAAIEGLKAVKSLRVRQAPAGPGGRVHLYTGSSYLKDGATRWLKAWSSGPGAWQTRDGKPVSNRDLWEALDELLRDQPVSWYVVTKGASGAPPEGMLRAKQLANEAARR